VSLSPLSTPVPSARDRRDGATGTRRRATDAINTADASLVAEARGH